jgi:hypothetical protein
MGDQQKLEQSPKGTMDPHPQCCQQSRQRGEGRVVQQKAELIHVVDLYSGWCTGRIADASNPLRN